LKKRENFYQRETELEKLSNWIFKQNTRLISVSGLYGTGKTTLVKRFIDLNLHKFAVVIWRSLKYPQPLELLVSDLLNVCQQEPQGTLDKQLKQLFNILANQKCLIIFDDLQNIFIPGKFAGHYKVAYQDYQNFFTMITEIKHQSHVIVISQEQCSEMEYLDDELCPIKSLEISGLYDYDVDILQNRGLKFYYVCINNNTADQFNAPPNTTYWASDSCSKSLNACRLRWLKNPAFRPVIWPTNRGGETFDQTRRRIEGIVASGARSLWVTGINGSPVYFPRRPGCEDPSSPRAHGIPKDKDGNYLNGFLPFGGFPGTNKPQQN
jgi:hypothetical protein